MTIVAFVSLWSGICPLWHTGRRAIGKAHDRSYAGGHFFLGCQQLIGWLFFSAMDSYKCQSDDAESLYIAFTLRYHWTFCCSLCICPAASEETNNSPLATNGHHATNGHPLSVLQPSSKLRLTSVSSDSNDLTQWPLIGTPSP